MKKTILVLGCLLAIGFSSVSCNRDDIPDTGPFTESKVVETKIQRSDLPKKVDHYLSAVLGENMYDATFTNKNVANPYSSGKSYITSSRWSSYSLSSGFIKWGYIRV